MVLGLQTIAHILIWCAQLFYISCFVPQIIQNFKERQTAGLSDVLLLGFLNGYSANFYYLFCLNLPSAYKIMTGIQALVFIILVAERIMFDKTDSYWYFGFFLWVNLSLILSVIPLGINFPNTVGNIAGWVGSILFTVSYISQIGRIYITKSVVGFSFSFVILTAIGVSLELIAANILNLPSQTHISLWRALTGCGIFTFQFWRYKGF